MEIEILKSLVKRLKKNTTVENWKILEDLIQDPELRNCVKCSGPIFYDYGKIRLSKEGKLKYDETKPSCKSYKQIDNQKFYLQVCQSCLSLEFPEYKQMNKTRVFNVMSKITKFAYGVPDYVVKKFTQKTAVTLENFIKKYGDVEGKNRWDNYCNLQSLTNKFEYKKEKYGWDEQKFKEFNKGRAITLKNMVKKYGKEEGKKVYDKYVEKQRINGNTLEWFIQKLGEKEGEIRYEKVSKEKAKGGLISQNSCSKVSQEFFDNIDVFLGKNYRTFYFKKNAEKIIYLKEEAKCFLLDYFIEDLNLSIEFHGDYFHANPSKYGPDFEFPEFSKKTKVITSKDLWEKDSLKYYLLEKYLGIKTIVVWESDYRRNKEKKNFYKKIIKQCLEK